MLVFGVYVEIFLSHGTVVLRSAFVRAVEFFGYQTVYRIGVKAFGARQYVFQSYKLGFGKERFVEPIIVGQPNTSVHADGRTDRNTCVLQYAYIPRYRALADRKAFGEIVARYSAFV